MEKQESLTPYVGVMERIARWTVTPSPDPEFWSLKPKNFIRDVYHSQRPEVYILTFMDASQANVDADTLNKLKVSGMIPL